VLRRFAARATLAMRVLAVALAVSLSGFAHFAADVAFAHEDTCETGEGDPCSDDGDGKQCPPGCPTCHCAHAQVPYVARATPCVLSADRADDELLAPVDVAPPSPPPRTLFRPPRA
jgi:hypothetical protein